MRSDNISEKIQDLALCSEHCWVQWRLPSEKSGSGAAVAILLEKNNENNLRFDGHYYNARSWYPQGTLMKELWEVSRPCRRGELKYTLQWSFPITSLDALICKVSALGSDFHSRVVELKFLKASDRTYNAPNSIDSRWVRAGHIVALNVWLDSEDDSIMYDLESQLISIPGGQPHLGKWASTRGLIDSEERLRSHSRLLLGQRCPASSSSLSDRSKSKEECLLSVILPVYNAMPWLPLAVRDILKQTLGGKRTEIIVGDDCSTDGSLEFLIDLAALLGDRGTVEVFNPINDSSQIVSIANVRKRLQKRRREILTTHRAKSINPALLRPSRCAELSSKISSGIPSEEAEIRRRPLTAEDVASDVYDHASLRVILSEQDLNTGQGAVMTRCLRLTQGKLIGHMESDDERPQGAFSSMVDALLSHPEWDGVTSLTKCIGWDSEGMKRYVEWQNRQNTTEKMKQARFLEIPSMHQTGVFRRVAVDLAIDGRHGCFRDDHMWAVDTHFWLNFFHKGLVCGKVNEILFYWRQHPGQQTRTHGRLSIENLRRCKCHFLCKDGGFIWEDTERAEHVVVQVWTSGNSETLKGYTDDLREELRCLGKSSRCEVVGVEWKPGQELPSLTKFKNRKFVRLFAFGMEKARQRVRAEISDWDDRRDIFVS